MTTHHTAARWTGEQVAELRRLTAAGLSARQIVEQMAQLRPGLTRNGVVGAWHRLRIEARPAIGHNQPKPQPKPQPKRAGAPKPLTPYTPPPLPPPPASTWAPLAGTTPKPLLEHEAGQCRWPVTGAAGETLFCCAAKRGDSPYCAAHTRIAWTPRPKTWRAP